MHSAVTCRFHAGGSIQAKKITGQSIFNKQKKTELSKTAMAPAAVNEMWALCR